MKIVVIGVGSTALNVVEILLSNHTFSIYGFVGVTEENKKNFNKTVYKNIRYLGDRTILKKLKNEDVFGFIVGVGERFKRELAFYEGISSGLIPINAISRNALIEPTVKIGKGVIINSGVTLSHNVNILDNCLIEPGVIMDINTVIGDNCNIGARSIISGECEISRNVDIGKGVIVDPKVNIGKNQTIAINEHIIKSLPDIKRKKISEI